MLLPTSEVHGKEGLYIKLIEAISLSKNADFRAKFDVDGLFGERFITVKNISDPGIDTDGSAELVRHEKIDPFIAQIFSILMRIGKTEEIFVSEV